MDIDLNKNVSTSNETPGYLHLIRNLRKKEISYFWLKFHHNIVDHLFKTGHYVMLNHSMLLFIQFGFAEKFK